MPNELDEIDKKILEALDISGDLGVVPNSDRYKERLDNLVAKGFATIARDPSSSAHTVAPLIYRVTESGSPARS